MARASGRPRIDVLSVEKISRVVAGGGIARRGCRDYSLAGTGLLTFLNLSGEVGMVEEQTIVGFNVARFRLWLAAAGDAASKIVGLRLNVTHLVEEFSIFDP